MAAHDVPSNLSSTPTLTSPKDALPSTKTDTAHVRNLADFPSSEWSRVFIECALNVQDVDLSSEWRKIEELKGEVGIKFDLYADKPLQQLALIDAIQQLGLGYQFQEEIDQALTSMFQMTNNVDIDGYGLCDTSLYFRLQRQHGHYVSSSIFRKFIDPSGALKEGFQSDVLGMVSFYEAAQLRVHADADILDEALARCVTHLESMAANNNLSPRLKTLVTNALEQSIHKNMPWLQARRYITTYQEDDSHDATLLRLAKLHFNVLQKQHQEELSNLSKWWKDLDLPSKCGYARDKLVEGYFWALAIYYEAHYRLGRKFFAISIAYFAVLDDTYDVYGTSDELELITESISRCNTSLFEQMPPYARALCQTLFDIYAVIEKDLVRDGKPAYHLPYFKEAVKLQSKFYHDESLLLKKKQEIPTMDEYKRLSYASSGITPLTVISLTAMGDIVTKVAFDWFLSRPEIEIACEGIGRILDDIVSHEFEQEREHIPSAVECYMNQYRVSKEEACKHLRELVSNCWKTLNEGYLKPTAFPFPILERLLNMARSMEVIYGGEGDRFTHSQKLLEDKMTSLLKDPVPI